MLAHLRRTVADKLDVAHMAKVVQAMYGFVVDLASREQAPQALKHLGVAALVAESFAGLFYRNALNLGLPAVVCPDAGRIRAASSGRRPGNRDTGSPGRDTATKWHRSSTAG